MNHIAVGHGEGRDGSVVEAKGAAASLTMEMRVRVVVDVSMMAMAQFIAGTPTPIVDDMHHVMVAEKRKGPEDTRLVEGENALFQFGERHRPW